MIPNYMHICHQVSILDGSASTMRKGVLSAKRTKVRKGFFRSTILCFTKKNNYRTMKQVFRDGDIGGFWVLMNMYIAFLIFYFVYDRDIIRYSFLIFGWP